MRGRRANPGYGLHRRRHLDFVELIDKGRWFPLITLGPMLLRARLGRGLAIPSRWLSQPPIRNCSLHPPKTSEGCGHSVDISTVADVRIGIVRSLMTISFPFAFLAVSVVFAGCAPVSSSLYGSPYPSPATAPGLALTDTQGSAFDLAALRGHATLVYFGYTQCPDECPLTLANARWAIEQLGELGDQVDFVLVTVDPANDTPAVLRTYLDQFNPRFIGLTGTADQLADARLAYGVLAVTPDADHEHSEVVHGTRVYLIDPAGMLVTSYDVSVAKEEVLSDLRTILNP